MADLPMIFNRRNNHIPLGAVYVGRGSPFGNPFKIVGGRRDKCLIKYRDWLLTQPDLIERIKRELRGKDLVCYCAPALCHAEILRDIANDLEETEWVSNIPSKQSLPNITG